MIKLIGPNQYSNFKSDMMSRNKIDAVNERRKATGLVIGLKTKNCNYIAI